MNSLSVTGCIVILFCMMICAEISDSTFAFQVQIGSQWQLAYTDTENTCFLFNRDNDETRIYIEKKTVDTVYGLKDQDYARIYFFAVYSLIEQQGGKVKFYDTSTAIKIGDLRAYELCSFRKDPEGILWFGEYSRWCAQGGFVYEITFLGDTLDIKENRNQYKALFNSFLVWYPDAATRLMKSDHRSIQTPSFVKEYAIDLTGRKIKRLRYLNQKTASGIYLFKSNTESNTLKIITTH
ncbi:MAG TPA: hypothetical protein VHP36_03145 [Chitinispirillaceae bacterium]|nr:hypothetical protein [Chitinispirillaceae bacterium]